MVCKGSKKPKDIANINWKGFNDVRTVYYNFTADCEDLPINSTNDTISVYGYSSACYTDSIGPVGTHSFALCDDPTFSGKNSTRSVVIFVRGLEHEKSNKGKFYMRGTIVKICDGMRICVIKLELIDYYVEE
jgi:hypothetical protein